MAVRADSEQTRVSAWQCTILLLSVYTLAALLIETTCTLPPQVSRLLELVDLVVCGAFLTDFVVQLVSAKRKLEYLRWGWIDLVSSIPALPFARVGRLARVVRIIRVMRSVRSMRVIVGHVFADRTRGAFASIAVAMFVLVVGSAIVMLNVETGPDSTITSAESALWWSLATITTVGYGDVYPKTSAGHVVAALVMVGGIALFGMLTAAVATLFVRHEVREEDAKLDVVIRKLDDIAERLQSLETERVRGIQAAGRRVTEGGEEGRLRTPGSPSASSGSAG